MSNTLEVDSVVVQFRNHRVLSDVFLKCQTGEVVGLLGLNGSGKSTLLKVMIGEVGTNNKSIRINGVSSYDYLKNGKIRFLPQHNFIPKSLSVKKAFSFFESDFDDFTKFFPELSHIYNAKLVNLSGGERRLVEIYLVLTSPSLFCLLDEPFSHIMPVHIEKIKELIVREKTNKGLVIVDHLYNYILDESDRLYLILSGKTHLPRKTEIRFEIIWVHQLSSSKFGTIAIVPFLPPSKSAINTVIKHNL